MKKLTAFIIFLICVIGFLLVYISFPEVRNTINPIAQGIGIQIGYIFSGITSSPAWLTYIVPNIWWLWFGGGIIFMVLMTKWLMPKLHLPSLSKKKEVTQPFMGAPTPMASAAIVTQAPVTPKIEEKPKEEAKTE